MEEWRDIPGYPGYQVSDLGNARSLDRFINSDGDASRGPYQRSYKGRMLKPGKDASGYLGCYPFGRIHVALMLAFVGPCPSGFEICHNDGNKSNNRRDNLRYDDMSGNQMDRVLHGTSNRGESHGMHKLTKREASTIKAIVGRTNQSIADQYGVSETAVRLIRTGKRWAWL